MATSHAKTSWTAEQAAAISAVGESVLVSAAAGSGKTAVLAERCAYLVCDDTLPCDVDDLLVVTFTEAAAAEMKARIQESLRQRGEAQPLDERLARQLALVDHAQVSTLHGFCARLLRQHFTAAGIDPAFRILDGSEAKLLRAEIARKLLRDRYGHPKAEAFTRFIDCYGEGDDQKLAPLLASTHEMLCSLTDPNAWTRAARRRLRETTTGTLAESELGGALHAWIARELGALQRLAADTGAQLRKLRRFDDYERLVADRAAVIDEWVRVFEASGLDALAEVVDIEFPNLPRTPSSPNKELARTIVDRLREEMKKGAWREALRFTTAQWQEGMLETLPHAEVFLDLVAEFERRYRAAKDLARALDFADLEKFTLKVLNAGSGVRLVPSEIAAAYHRRFRHVLVDEYQDINELQDSILWLISRESVGRPPGRKAASDPRAGNLFCVGDVKQSIYRFRLAEPERFLEREQRFRAAAGAGRVIDLQANFRSRGPLLEAINGVFERLMIRQAADIQYDQSHRLVAMREFPPANGMPAFTGSPIELHVLPGKLPVPEDPCQAPDPALELERSEREALLVARRIRQMLGMEPGSRPMQVADRDARGDRALRPLRFGDIVILLRSMRYKSEQFSSILDAEGIPVHADSVTGYFESMEVRDMLALLHVLDNRQQDIPLVALLRSPLGGLPEPDDALARIRMAYPTGDAADLPFHLATERYADEQDDELAARLRDLRSDLQRWRDAAQRRPLDELIWKIFQESGFLALCQGLSNGEQRVANLLYLHERASQFATFQRQGLSRFMDFLESLREDAELGLPSTASRADDVVRIMSIHHSKGLEFPVVFLADIGKAINLQDCHGAILRDRRLGLGLAVVDERKRVRYPSLASTLVRDRLRQQAMAEELRVLYVAMTRAQEHLVLVGSTAEKDQAAWKTRWSGQRGALPADEILQARSMIDWIGPVAAATGDAPAPIFQTTFYAAEDVGAWRSEKHRWQKLTPRQMDLAELKPLDPPPPSTEVAEGVIRRLSFVYPHEALAQAPAVGSVTGQSKKALPGLSLRPVAPAQAARLQWTLTRPKFLAEERIISAADRGTATHLVLQHLDFARPMDAAGFQCLIQEMIERHSISPVEAAAVDLEALAWFAETDLGRLLREHAPRLRREITVYFPALVEGTAPVGDDGVSLDRVMIRGRLDLLLPLPDGNIIVDYKTDAVDRASAVERAQQYKPQMEMYREAVRRITGVAVKAIHLVFLTPRCVINL